jgi:competence protein ComEC
MPEPVRREPPVRRAPAWTPGAVFLFCLCLPACRRAAPPPLPLPEAPARTLAVSFLDVGSGESALIQAPGGAAVLVDGGDEAHADAVLEVLRRRGVRRLTGVVATRPAPERVGGLLRALAVVPAAWIMDSGFPDDGGLTQRLISRAQERQVEYRMGRAGQEIPLEAGVKLEVLGPSEPFIQGSGPTPRTSGGVGTLDAENASIVFRLTDGRVRFLFTGDMRAAEWERILGSPQSRWLPADVLKVPDHGRHLDADLLRRVHPRLAVISCGAGGPAALPDPATLALLQKSGIPTRRTDQDGSIVVSTDGRDFQVRTSAGASLGGTHP